MNAIFRPGTRPGRALLARTAVAVGGGYAFASSAAVFLGAVLPLPGPEAVLAATLPAFALYTAAIVWTFAARDLHRVARGLFMSTFVLGGAGLLLARGGA